MKRKQNVSGPVFRGIHQSIMKHGNTGNVNFYKVLYGEQTSLAHSVCCHKNLIKTTIFKLMVLRNTLVYDSDNCPTY